MIKFIRENKILSFALLALCVLGLFFRLYHIEFGLPHSFYADEPEIAEPAIKYTYEFKDVVTNNNFYKLIPVSFVYGTFPVYVFTVATMAFSKFNNLFNLTFDKTSIFIFLRVVNALITLTLIPIAITLYKKLFSDKLGLLVITFLSALNWKLIVHAHYLNQDIILVILLTLTFITFHKYFSKNTDTIYTIITGLLFGLCVGTKITALISAPLFLYVFLVKKDLRGFLGFVITTLISFAISNPFSIILSSEFIFRIYSMLGKEAGMVFDSVDYSATKYLSALVYMCGPFVIAAAAYGIGVLVRSKKLNTFHIFLLGHIIFYLLFYTIQSRRVDRWMLPILPIIFLYAAYGISKFVNTYNTARTKLIITCALFVISYLYYPTLLLSEFQRWTPKSAAYLWLKERVNALEPNQVIGITEEGLDPINKLPYSKGIKFNVYANEGAQFDFPPAVSLYKYVVISSRPMENFKRDDVSKIYPYYAQRWTEFESMLEDTNRYELVKDFTLIKPNLIPLSDVRIYKSLDMGI